MWTMAKCYLCQTCWDAEGWKCLYYGYQSVIARHVYGVLIDFSTLCTQWHSAKCALLWYWISVENHMCVVLIELYLHFVRVQHFVMREVCGIRGGFPLSFIYWITGQTALYLNSTHIKPPLVQRWSHSNILHILIEYDLFDSAPDHCHFGWLCVPNRWKWFKYTFIVFLCCVFHIVVYCWDYAVCLRIDLVV